jgi:hypothetical protein
VHIYDQKSKEERSTLAKQWQWCKHNLKARKKLEKLKKRDNFVDFCYHTRQLRPEDIKEADLFQAMQEFCTQTPPVAISEPAPIVAQPEPEIPLRSSRYGLRERAPREATI